MMPRNIVRDLHSTLQITSLADVVCRVDHHLYSLHVALYHSKVDGKRLILFSS
jgi:hypothetical protein